MTEQPSPSRRLLPVAGSDDLRRYCCEFIGTFSLVFFAAGAVVVDAKMGGTLGAIGSGLISGLIITVVIYAFGHVSGAHVNPALSFAAALIGHLDWRLVPGYALAQLAGSVLAGMCLYWALGDFGAMGANLPNAALGITPLTAFLIELFVSFLLMWVVAGVGPRQTSARPLRGRGGGRGGGHRGDADGPGRRRRDEPGTRLGSLCRHGRLHTLLDLRRRPAHRHGARRLRVALHPRAERPGGLTGAPPAFSYCIVLARSLSERLNGQSGFNATRSFASACARPCWPSRSAASISVRWRMSRWAWLPPKI